MAAAELPVKDYVDRLIFSMENIKKARAAVPSGPFPSCCYRAGACGRFAGSRGTSTVAETVAGASGVEPMRG